MAAGASTNLLPPPPIREPIFSGEQFKGAAMNQIWVNWFTQLFQRAGQGFGSTNSDLEVLGAYADISNGALASQVSNLEIQTNQNTADIDVLLAAMVSQANTIQELQVLGAFN